ncbi:hypothetical protein [Desulfocurvus sp. DL9XJH121]
MKTKSYVRFLNRFAHFDADIELADVVSISNDRGILNKNAGEMLFDAVDVHRHPRLAGRDASPHNRKIAIGHLKVTLYSSFIKDIYEDMTMYFREVLEAAAKKGISPNRLTGECNSTFKVNDILLAGNWDNVVKMISEAIFRQIENKKSTKELIAQMNAKLNLGVAQEKIDAALPFLEIRHLLVHADGIADQKFCSSFPRFGATAGHPIHLGHNEIQNARTTISALINAFDQAIVANGLVDPAELQP